MLLFACLPGSPGRAAEPAACGPDRAGSPCGEEQAAGLPATGGVPQGVGNPVNLITGNKHQRESDMAALPGALGLELVRHYNSELARPGMPLHGIGRGWQFSYDTRLTAQGRTLQIVQADGARRIFARGALSTALFASADPAEGMVRIVRDDSILHYRWRWPDGRELGFDRNGRLRRIALPGGQALTIERLADGRLSTVTDPQGRSLAFHYLTQAESRPGRLSAIRYVDTPVGRISYDYGDTAPGGLPQQAENLVAVHLPTRHEPGKLRSLDGRGDHPSDYSSSSLRRRYHYEDARFPTLLTGISVTGTGSDGRELDERIVRWAYDANGLAVLSASGRAAQGTVSGNQPAAGAGLLMLDRRTPGRTTVTDGDGRVTIFRHAIVNGVFRLLEARGAGCEPCGPVNLRYRYDNLGRLQEVTRLDAQGLPVEGRRQERDPLGRVIASKTVQYARGREIGRTLALRQLYRPAGMAAMAPRAPKAPGASPAARPPASQQGPKQIAMPSVLAGHDHQTVIEYNQRQQPLTVTQSGYQPVDGSMQARATRYRYDEIAGRSLLSEIDGPLPNGPDNTPADSDITRYEWDVQGAYVRRIRHPMGAISEIEYDPHTGRLTVLTLRWERTVRQMRYAYDPLGQVERIQERALDVDGVKVLAERTLGIRWNALGRPSALVEADGTVRELGEDGLAGAPAVAAAFTATAPAVVGNALSAALAGTAGRPGVPDMASPPNQSGAPVPATSALWPTQYGDPLTAAAHEALRFDANGRSAERRIDDFGQVVAVRNPGQGWQHARYDEAGRLVEIHDPRGASTLARYDAAGRLLRVDRTLPGDAPERLDMAWRGPERLSETVTTAGRQTHATHYRHNPWGQVSQMQVEIAGAEGGAPVRMSLQSRYDAAGRLIARTLPGGERLAWRYYASAPYRGQQAAIERIHWPIWLDGLMTRLPEAWLDRWRLKTRIAAFTPREPDQAMAVASGASTLATPVAFPATTAGATGMPALAGAAPPVEPGLSAQAPGAEHDAAGLPRRLQASGEELALRWNAAGQLVEVSEVGAAANAAPAESPNVVRYHYDARGRRASKHTAGGAEYYLYEGIQLIAAVKIDPQGRRSLSQYLYEGYRAVAWLRGGIAHALQTDSRGALSEVRSLDDDGKPAQTLWRAQLNAWGSRPASEPPSPHDPKLRLLNQYADEETGLSYHIARYYDPSQGRFLSPDPAGIADTLAADVPPALRLDLTAYVAGQPWFYVDPDGAARLIYYAITTDAKGKQLGTTQGFTRARWAFSIDGIEASGDGGSDAINQLMEKYAKNQTGLLFDGEGNYLTGGKKAVSWNGSADETVDGFRKHYGKNLIGLPNFTIENFNNRDAALLVAGLMKDKDGDGLCNDRNALLPKIRFLDGEDDIIVTQKAGPDLKYPANNQRIVNCNNNARTSLPVTYADDLERQRVERIEAAAELTETSALNKDCSADGCPGIAIYGQSGSSGEAARVYHASYGRSQFVAATFIETLDRLSQEDKESLGLTNDIQQRITKARRRAERLNSDKGFFELARQFACADAPGAWDNAGGEKALKLTDRNDFIQQTLLDRQNFIDMSCFVPVSPAKPIGEGKNAFITESIFADAQIKNWLMNMYKSYDYFNLVSRTFIRKNLRSVLANPDIKDRFQNSKLTVINSSKSVQEFKDHQRSIEHEIAMRVARLHNGGNGAFSTDIDTLSRKCVRGGPRPCDTGDYVKTFIGILPNRGDWVSLRCGEMAEKNGIELNPLVL